VVRPFFLRSWVDARLCPGLFCHLTIYLRMCAALAGSVLEIAANSRIVSPAEVFVCLRTQLLHNRQLTHWETKGRRVGGCPELGLYRESAAGPCGGSYLPGCGLWTCNVCGPFPRQCGARKTGFRKLREKLCRPRPCFTTLGISPVGWRCGQAEN
jgi:hypothetical protein